PSVDTFSLHDALPIFTLLIFINPIFYHKSKSIVFLNISFTDSPDSQSISIMVFPLFIAFTALESKGIIPTKSIDLSLQYPLICRSEAHTSELQSRFDL